MQFWFWRRHLLDSYSPVLLRRRTLLLLISRITLHPCAGMYWYYNARHKGHPLGGALYQWNNVWLMRPVALVFRLFPPFHLLKLPSAFPHTFLVYLINGIAVNNQFSINHGQRFLLIPFDSIVLILP